MKPLIWWKYVGLDELWRCCWPDVCGASNFEARTVRSVPETCCSRNASHQISSIWQTCQKDVSVFFCGRLSICGKAVLHCYHLLLQVTFISLGEASSEIRVLTWVKLARSQPVFRARSCERQHSPVELTSIWALSVLEGTLRSHYLWC